MPKCKNCHENISRLDRDICPFCGQVRPLDGVEDETKDYTTTFDPVKAGIDIQKHKSRVVAGLLAIFLGIFGANAFYLFKPRMAISMIAITLIMIIGGGCTLYFTNLIPNAFAFLTPYFIEEAFMIVLGIVYFVRHDIVDGHGGEVR